MMTEVCAEASSLAWRSHISCNCFHQTPAFSVLSSLTLLPFLLKIRDIIFSFQIITFWICLPSAIRLIILFIQYWLTYERKSLTVHPVSVTQNVLVLLSRQTTCSTEKLTMEYCITENNFRLPGLVHDLWHFGGNLGLTRKELSL